MHDLLKRYVIVEFSGIDLRKGECHSDEVTFRMMSALQMIHGYGSPGRILQTRRDLSPCHHFSSRTTKMLGLPLDMRHPAVSLSPALTRSSMSVRYRVISLNTGRLDRLTTKPAKKLEAS